MSVQPDVLTPYARALGIEVAGMDGGIALVLPFASSVEGRPGVLHGGAIGGLLETAGYAAVQITLAEQEIERRLKPINVTVQFLSAGRPHPTYAQGRIVRLGRRVANVAVEAWQADRAKPIATAVMNIMVAPARPPLGSD
ncbi:PaaI family thioesterase [Erythrobacteraceae bacterium CFH 75059]|uniref:PaaI family thioesterase n=1 Tax=Qipengyuania thermophila TaxID=2509361 RepID=UPI0010228E2C|nr:PaaI family thioesterase [Qipengyuania thermophila]TCD04933.1 PaaI family thioesterase [Erythrobacteraceae bacterium CFH 75059]